MSGGQQTARAFSQRHTRSAFKVETNRMPGEAAAGAYGETATKFAVLATRPLDRPYKRVYVYTMETRLTYTYWQDGDYFVGYLNDYPDDSTQGLTLGELEEALKEVYEIRREERLRLSRIRHTGTLTVSA